MSGLAIARYFTVAARQSAATATYSTRSAGTARGTYRRTADGRDPLGVLLQADGYGSKYRCPDTATGASAIYSKMPPAGDTLTGLLRQRAIGTDVAAFNIAWDAGEIADLADALGIRRENGRPIGKSGASATIARKVPVDAAVA